MQCRKRLVFIFLVFMISVGVAWAGERGYQLVASKDSKLCARMLEAFREDVDDRGRLRYQHEIFLQIAWKPVELKGQGPKTRHCSSLDKAIVDLDNDGQLDLVVKATFCMKGAPSDSLYKFPLIIPFSIKPAGKICHPCWQLTTSLSAQEGRIRSHPSPWRTVLLP